MNQKVISTFFSFIRLGLGISQSLPFKEITDNEWSEMLNIAHKQTMSGILMDAIDILPNDVSRPHKDILINLMRTGINIEKYNRIINLKAVEVTQYFEKKGMEAILLKGQGLATLYPNPLHRTPGDIDLWVNADRKVLMDICNKELKSKEFTYHHIDVKMADGIELEVHTTPSWMYSYFRNRKLQKLFKEWAKDAKYIELPEGVGKVKVPSDEMNRMYLLIHLYRHVFHEGIGLRQMADYALFLSKGCTEEEKSRTMGYLKELNMTKFAGAVMYVMKEVFGLEEKYLFTSPDKKRGKILLQTILEGGNFGKYDISIDRKIKKDSAMSFITRNARNLKLIKEYPEEVIWGPAFKLWHFLWRTMNKN